MDPITFRKLCKNNKFNSHTSGCVPGYSQANILVLPKSLANDFIDLCQKNPVPCPLLGMTMLGSPNMLDNKAIINDNNFDLRTDLPKYDVYYKGELVEQVNSLVGYWRLDEHIGFIIGCSFSFEQALMKEGLTPKNVKKQANVSMYITSKMLNPAGMFKKCPYVVSMRPYKKENLEKVREITRKFKKTHGEPIDWGYDAVKRLGIKDLSTPDFGSPCDIEEDEIPVFWACGVTSQVAALQGARNLDQYVFSHVPGHMLILDIKDVDMQNL